jgi:hypothetical protein
MLSTRIEHTSVAAIPGIVDSNATHSGADELATSLSTSGLCCHIVRPDLGVYAEL